MNLIVIIIITHSVLTDINYLLLSLMTVKFVNTYEYIYYYEHLDEERISLNLKLIM